MKVTVHPRRLVQGVPTDVEVRLTNTGAGPCTNVILKLRLPPALLQLRGRDRLEVGTLPAGGSVVLSLSLRGSRQGQCTLGASNFSYRDDRGTSHHITDLAVDLAVDAAPPAAPPPVSSFTVSLSPHRLRQGEWGTVRGEVVNTGEAVLSDLDVQLSGPLVVEGRTVRSLGDLAASGTTPFEFPVRADERGQVPVHLAIHYRDGSGRRRGCQQTRTVQVGEPATAPESQVRILYLSANPEQTTPIGLERELKAIRHELLMGRERHRFTLDSYGAVEDRDITFALQNSTPQIVHFSGHGEEGGDLYVEAAGGGPHILTAEAFAKLLGQSDSIECVIVNACHSEGLAQRLVTRFDHVVGMKTRIGDDASVAFSIGFYQALSAGHSIPHAVEAGRALIKARVPNWSDDQAPILLTRPDRERPATG